MSTAARAIAGRCLCGGVRYQVTGALGPIIHCHCTQCRRASGTAFATNASVSAAAFDVVAGADLLAAFESSPGKLRHFCGRCGSPTHVTHAAMPGVVRIRLGGLDDDPGGRPAAHIFTGSKACWFEIEGELERFPEMPPPAFVAPGKG